MKEFMVIVWSCITFGGWIYAAGLSVINDRLKDEIEDLEVQKRMSEYWK